MTKRVLVLCTGNSCRSVMAEALFNHLGQGDYEAVSAGSFPAGYVHPKSIETLKRHGIDPGSPRSKSWDEFAGQNFDLVVTVCDQAGGETCPLFHGKPQKLHWSTPDPAKATGTDIEIEVAFDQAYSMLKERIEDFLMPNHNHFNLLRKLIAEALGTALLVTVVVGSGIMGEELAGGNVAIALLANAIATGAALVVLILIFSPISGAHFNPVVSLSFALQRRMRWSELMPYVVMQITGAIIGTIIAHIMFDLPMVVTSTHERSGFGIWIGEIVATFGLLATILGCLKNRPEAIPYAVGLFITAGYWFTSSTSFANPAVTIARSLTDTFAGIRPNDVLGFIGAQIVGSLLATGLFCWLYPAQIVSEPK